MDNPAAQLATSLIKEAIDGLSRQYTCCYVLPKQKRECYHWQTKGSKYCTRHRNMLSALHK